MYYVFFIFTNCHIWLVPHVWQEMFTHFGTPAFTLFGEIQIQIQNNFIVPYTYMYIGVFYNKVNNSY